MTDIPDDDSSDDTDLSTDEAAAILGAGAESVTADTDAPDAAAWEEPGAPAADPVLPAPDEDAMPDLDAGPDEAEADAGDLDVVDVEDLLEGPPRPKRESPYDRPGNWFVVHTQSGYEKKVKSNLESRIHSMNMEDSIFEVVIPMEDVIEFKNGKKVVVQKKVYPGYLYVRCFLDDRSWDVIRNTPGVTGFVGTAGKPHAAVPQGRRGRPGRARRRGRRGRPDPQAAAEARVRGGRERAGPRRAPSPTSPARSPRSTRTSSRSRCSSTSSAGRPRSSSSSPRSPSSDPPGRRPSVAGRPSDPAHSSVPRPSDPPQKEQKEQWPRSASPPS